jgi:hypothetical protein
MCKNVSAEKSLINILTDDCIICCAKIDKQIVFFIAPSHTPELMEKQFYWNGSAHTVHKTHLVSVKSGR